MIGYLITSATARYMYGQYRLRIITAVQSSVSLVILHYITAGHTKTLFRLPEIHMFVIQYHGNKFTCVRVCLSLCVFFVVPRARFNTND